MRTSQQKFLEEFDKIAKDLKLDLTIDKGASNIGQGIYSRGWSPLLVFSFNFQTGYCVIKMYNGLGATRNPSENQLTFSPGMLYYTQGSKIHNMFNNVRRFLGLGAE